MSQVSRHATLSVIVLISFPVMVWGCSSGALSGEGIGSADANAEAASDSESNQPGEPEAEFGVPCEVDEDCLDAFEVLECEMTVCAQPYGTCILTVKPPGSPCKDGVTCTGPDYCIEGVCGGSPLMCDDEDPCTDDTCDEKLGCVHTPGTGAFCDDGNPCSSGDTCQEGICEGGPAIEGCCQWDPQCNDGDPCTEDTCQVNSCVYAFTQAPCDDGEPCTYQDYCDGAGECAGAPLPCDDGNPCTVDQCDPSTGACTTTPEDEGAPCNDYNPCTSSDTCQAGVCVGGSNTCQCTSDGDCALLEDGDLCNGTFLCAGNTCVLDPNSVVTCNPAGDTACQKSSCDPTTGQCVPTAMQDGSPCDDQDACSEGDQCAGGLCVGTPLACDDANDCTYDACSLSEGCTHSAKSGACDDQDPCTANDQCAASVCSGEPMCDDANPCTDDYCDAILGCAWLPLEGGCDDGDACTIGDLCVEGLCVPGPGLECDDGESCTSDGCVAGACSFAALALGTPCDDDDLCTEGDTCTEEGCVGEPGLLCDDGNPCTLDACEEGVCTATLVEDGVQCDAGDPCVLTSACEAGVCTALEAKVCDDDNECTQDLCVLGTCEHPPVEDGTLCGGGEACGSASCCHSGTCASIEVPACPPALCAEVVCSEGGGACVTTPTQGPCCGDGVQDEGELCDDGNAYLDDDCDADCEPSGCAARSALQGPGAGMLMYPTSLLSEFESATIELWLNPADTTQDAVLFHRKESGGVDWFKMSYAPEGGAEGVARLSWQERIADGTVKTIMGPPLVAGVWQHVALVRRFSLSEGEVDWYVDGALQPGAEPYVGMIDIGSADLLYVGCQAGYAKSFQGGLDELRISSVARYEGSFTPSSEPFTPDADTVALYHFDDQHPGVGVDQSSGGFHLQWHGVEQSAGSPFELSPGDDATCQVEFCQPGALTIFSGIDTSGTIAHPDALDLTQSFTLELFVKIDANEAAVILARGDDAEASWLLHHDSIAGASTFIWSERTEEGGLVDVASTTPVALDTWHHVAVTRHHDAVSNRAYVRVYVNGLRASGCGLIVGAKAFPAGEALHVAALPGGGAHFHGALDELRFSDGAQYTSDFEVPELLHVEPRTLALFHLDSRIPADRYNAVPGGFGPLVINGASALGGGAVLSCP